MRVQLVVNTDEVFRRLAILLTLYGAVMAVSAPAIAAEAPVLRPTEGGQYAFSGPEVPPIVGPRAVVHYTKEGKAAPDMTDADANGTPDYVERVAAAAERSLTYYAARGFLKTLPDTAGPNELLDVYVTSLPEGLLGRAIPAQQAASGGGFFVVSNELSIARVNPVAGIEITMAHELFHMVQFAYFPPPLNIPYGTIWGLEGTATAMSTLVYPEITDQNNRGILDDWLKNTEVPLYYFDPEKEGCGAVQLHCYGGAWWWLWLDRIDGQMISEYYGRLYGYAKAGRSAALGLRPLSELLTRRGYNSLYTAFTQFSLDLYRRNPPGLEPFYRLQAKYSPAFAVAPKGYEANKKDQRIIFVDGLSAQYVPVTTPAGARGMEVLIESARGPTPKAWLVLGGPQGRVLTTKLFVISRKDKVNGLRFQVRFKSAAERNSMLILTSGRQDEAIYRLQYRALR